MKRDPSFAKSIINFFGIEEEKPIAKQKKKNKSLPKNKDVMDVEEEKELVILQREIAETEQRLRSLYLKQSPGGKKPVPNAEVPKKINPTYLSYAGSEISYGIKNNKKKYEVDVIGNIIKRNEELDVSFHTIDGIKRFGAGLKNLNNETTMNPIPQKYSNQYQ